MINYLCGCAPFWALPQESSFASQGIFSSWFSWLWAHCLVISRLPPSLAAVLSIWFEMHDIYCGIIRVTYKGIRLYLQVLFIRYPNIQVCKKHFQNIQIQFLFSSVYFSCMNFNSILTWLILGVLGVYFRLILGVVKFKIDSYILKIQLKLY